MRLSKEIVSHIFSAWCAESGEPVLWNWIKNNDPMSVFHPIFADFYEGKVNLDDFIQSAIESDFPVELHEAFVRASKDTEATDSEYHYGIALLQRISDVDPANLTDVYITDADLDGEWELVTAYGSDTEASREALQTEMAEIQLEKASGWVVIDDKPYYRVVETVIVDDEGTEIDSRLFSEASVFEDCNCYDIVFENVNAKDIDEAQSYINEYNYDRNVDLYLCITTSAYNITESAVELTDVEINLEQCCIGETLDRIEEAL
jgi:hypothetical protein